MKILAGHRKHMTLDVKCYCSISALYFNTSNVDTAGVLQIIFSYSSHPTHLIIKETNKPKIVEDTNKFDAQ